MKNEKKVQMIVFLLVIYVIGVSVILVLLSVMAAAALNLSDFVYWVLSWKEQL